MAVGFNSVMALLVWDIASLAALALLIAIIIVGKLDLP
jgi:hypothetical protein